jgi:hypothetical protein
MPRSAGDISAASSSGSSKKRVVPSRYGLEVSSKPRVMDVALDQATASQHLADA